MEDLECPNCKKIFKVYPCEKQRRKYCSKKCYADQAHKIKVCPICKNEFKSLSGRHQIYCSHRCSNRVKTDKLKLNAKKIKFKCLNCSQETTLLECVFRSGKPKFCSRKCYGKFKKYLKPIICPGCNNKFSPRRSQNGFIKKQPPIIN